MTRVVSAILLGIVLGLVIGVGAFVATSGPAGGPRWGLEMFDRPRSDVDRSVVFTVRAGESAASIGDRLEQQGIITSSLLFRLLVNSYEVERNLTAGEYELSPAMTTTAIIQKLNRGIVRTTSVAILEGWRLGQMASRLDRTGIFGRADFEAALERVRAGPLASSLVPQGFSLEGYLLPDTYRIEPSLKADQFVELMLRSFDQRVTPAMREKYAAQGLTLHQAVTLASIVEREAVVDEERPIIASVFLNRLRLGMPLQADPTVQYALTTQAGSVDRFGWWKPALTVQDLRVPSPYNTYLVRGLPPGPICAPGILSLRAVADPAQTDYLYFVARDGRTHLFARTLEEHNRNVASVRK